MPSADRRQLILAAALDAFAAGGYHETSLEEVAERAGISKALIYEHFSSKRKLHRALLETYVHELLATVSEATGGAMQDRTQDIAEMDARVEKMRQAERQFQGAAAVAQGRVRDLELQRYTKSGAERFMSGHAKSLEEAEAAVKRNQLDAAKKTVDFDKDIKPIFEKSCVKCHSGEKPKGKYSMETKEGIMKEAVKGDSAKSELVHLAADLVADSEMPPLDKRDKYPALTKEQIGLIRAWIDQGAK